MTAPHDAVHDNAAKSIQAYQRGDIKDAEQYLNEMDKVSKELIALLEETKKI